MIFVYEARDLEGRQVRGFVMGSAPEAAARDILAQGLFPVRVQASKAPLLSRRPPEGGWLRSPPRSRGYSPRVSRRDIMFWTRQLSDLSKAGLPLLNILTLSEAAVARGGLGSVVARVRVQVQEGEMLSKALAVFPKIFSPVYVQMVKAAETGGYLGDGLERLAHFLEKDEEARQGIKNSLVYPAFVLALGSLAVATLLMGVVPRVAGVYEEFGQVLPWATRFLLRGSGWAREWGGLVLGLGVLAAAVGRMVVATPTGRTAWDRFLWQLLFVGMWQQENALAHFSRTAGLLLSNGVPAQTALTTASGVVENRHAARCFLASAALVTGGEGLSAALKTQGLLKGPGYQIVSAAESGGEPGAGFLRLADYLDRRISRRTKYFLTLLEPALILALGGVTGFFVYAMTVPVFRLNLMVR